MNGTRSLALRLVAGGLGLLAVALGCDASSPPTELGHEPSGAGTGGVSTGGAMATGGNATTGGTTTGGTTTGGTGGTTTGGITAGGTPSSGGAAGASGGASGAGGKSTSVIGSYFDGSTRFDGLPETSCTITITRSELSPDMATVGVVSFTTSLAGLTAAEIHFGRDTGYGLVAPVDLTQPGYRTLLLGMVQDSAYHYRVAVSDGRSVCFGEDQLIETGTLSSRALAEATTSDGAAPGFIVTSRDSEAVIYDKQGEIVWAYPMPNVFSVQLSWDGVYLIGRDPGPFDLDAGGLFFRVKLDGSDFTVLDAPGGDHHDFTAIPGGIAYLAKVAIGECDRIYEASTEIVDGVPVFDTWPIYRYFPDEGSVEGTEICHANRLRYSLEKDWYTVSDRNKDAIAVFTRSGAPVTSIGKTPMADWELHIQAESAGPGGDWHVQHGHHWYADDKLVLFSNDSRGGAALLHYTIDGSGAALDWKYTGAGASLIQGDAERLPNGNFLVTANSSGTIVELAPDGRTELGRYVLAGPQGVLYGFNYSSHRASLYGAPAPR